MNLNKFTFKTERLTLRAWREDDLNDFYEYACVDGVGEMAGWPHHKSIDDTKKILEMFLNNDNIFAICYNKNDKLIGSIEVRDEKHPIDDDKTKINKNIGFVLSKDYWGRGLMPEAASFLIDYLFKNNLCDNIYMAYFDYNNRSKRVQEKLGLKKVREEDEKVSTGNIEHSIVMRLSKDEWNNNNNM